MGPAILKKQRGETLYSLRVLPLGGFCQMEGEDEDSPSDNAFNNKPIGSRVLVIIMGSAMNLLTGFIIILVLNMLAPALPTTTVEMFKQGVTPSQTAGLQVGDRIVQLNGERMHITEDILFFMARLTGEDVDITVIRNGEKVLIHDVSFPYEEIGKEQLTGDFRDEGKMQKMYRTDFYVSTQPKTIFSLLGKSFYKSIAIVKMVWISLFDLISGQIPITDVSGPVGVTDAIGTAAKTGLLSLLNLLALLSINLGVINLFPLPALDGGRLVFLVIEGIIGRPVPAKYEAYIHYGGFVLLIGLSVFLAYNDIIRLIFRG
jgi:regulator of sigma E protease